MNKELNIDAMKYRTHTHLAGVDVELVISEKGKCEYIIKECYYAKNVNVSGNKTNGYFIEWTDSTVMPMVVNSGNRKKIAQIALQTKQLPSMVEARNIGNWNGLTIELKFNPTITMMGKVVGGIVVALPEFKPMERVSDVDALAKMDKCKTKEQLNEAWKTITVEERNLPTVQAKLAEFKAKFATNTTAQ